MLHSSPCVIGLAIFLNYTLGAWPAAAQSSGIGPAQENETFIRAVMIVKGAASEEDLCEEEIDKFEKLVRKPLDINHSTRTFKLASGLFSPYQVAVLEDHRARSGDILSLAELSLLDGFGSDFVRAISLFVTVEGGEYDAAASRHPLHEITLRGGVRHDSGEPEPEGLYALKYEFSSPGNKVEAGLALRSSWTEPYLPPSDRSFYVSARNRKGTFRTVVGDYNLKFGQGLALWSGFSMSGLSAPASFSKNPIGISPYSSYSGEGTFRGLAANYNKKNLTFSAFIAGTGLRGLAETLVEGGRPETALIPGFNIGWLGFKGQASLTAFLRTSESGASGQSPLGFSPELMKIAADGRYSFKGTDIFTELACCYLPETDLSGRGRLSEAGLAGVRKSFGKNTEAAFLIRYYPADYDGTYSGAVRSSTRCSNEHGISLSVRQLSEKTVNIEGRTGFGSSERLSDFSASVDLSYAPEPRYGTDTSSLALRTEITENLRISPILALKAGLRLQYRTWSYPVKAQTRMELKINSGPWIAKIRTDLLKYKDFACAAFAEAGYKISVVSAYLRAGVFRVDNWDDRIYVYERDAPGTFNVPALYGRGCWLALTASIKPRPRIAIHLRTSLTAWPEAFSLTAGLVPPKPTRTTLTLQLNLKI